MALSWSNRRKTLYSGVIGAIVFLVLIFLYQTFLTTPATCFDLKQNGDEHGVDCGGSKCSLMCASESRAPVVQWARAFKTSPNTYTAAAYIQNSNAGGGAKNVRYSFQLFDDKNQLVIERDGTVNLPPVQTIPIVENGIEVGNRAVSRTLFAFFEQPVWNTIPASAVSSLRVSNQYLAGDGSRLSATLTNDTVADAKNITVTGILFDAAGVARAASKSVLSRVPKKSSQDVVFTWPGGNSGIVRAEITVLPSF